MAASSRRRGSHATSAGDRPGAGASASLGGSSGGGPAATSRSWTRRSRSSSSGVPSSPTRSWKSGLIGQPLACERGGGEGEPGGSPSVSKKGAAWGKHGFPPRERARGERRSCRGGRLLPEQAAYVLPFLESED